MTKFNLVLKPKVSATLSSGYKPKFDSMRFIDDETGIWYMPLRGIIWWIVKLGRVDTCDEVSMISSHSATPPRKDILIPCCARLHRSLDCGCNNWSELLWIVKRRYGMKCRKWIDNSPMPKRGTRSPMIAPN